MKNWIYILMIGLMGSLVSSCQQSLDDEVQLPITTGKAQITFTIALDDIDSRAAWEDNEGATDAVVGSVNENAINLDSEDGLQVFVYDLQGKLLGEVINKEVRKIDTNTYSFNGNLEIDNLQSSTLPCRLMVYANCIESNETFKQSVEYIPMWGVKETTLQLAKGELTKLTEPIYLLRAMAKVEVKLDASIAEDFDLTSVLVDKYNSTGNVLPSYSYTTLQDTELMDDQSVFNPNASLVENALAFNEVEGEETFFIYLPEYQNVGEGASLAQITVQIGDKTYPLEFKMYDNDDDESNDQYFNIVRNHYYQYVITSVTESEVEVELSLRYQVIDWEEIEHPTLDFN